MVQMERCESCWRYTFIDDFSVCLVCGAQYCHECSGCRHTPEQERAHYAEMALGSNICVANLHSVQLCRPAPSE